MNKIDLLSVVGKGYGKFWRDKHRYRVLKGGRGSKKSKTMALWVIYNMMRHKDANTLVVRKTFATHQDSTFADLQWAANKLGVQDLWSFLRSPLTALYIPTGQKILFRGFDDPLKLTSITVANGVLCWVWIEEAYEIVDPEEFRILDESIRGQLPEGLYHQLTLTYNPWVMTHWTKTRFFDNVDPDAFTLTTTHKCNEWLTDKDHELIEALKETHPERYKVVGLGEYGMPGGQYFDEFTESVHVIEPFIIPGHWKKYYTLDYGLDMAAGYVIAVDEHNKAYVINELYQPGLIISNAAKEVLRISEGYKIYSYFAPPDLWNRRQETGKSVADIFRDNGINLIMTNNDRVHGWYNVKEWLAIYNDEQGIPTAALTIFKNCRNLIRSIQSIQCDEKDPNDCATEPHEITHAPDAIRGFLAGRPRPAYIAPPEPLYNFSIERPKPDAIRGTRRVI